ncbi:hypothetical protein MPTK1_2g08830 [Marchantia polymorpha subsp. ruderalis]|uniref:Secreted protein n=1 Tax=Marchantia polymorpha TaxID=3197 RepID=A0A2R6XGZ8_MARPO|nr:hypothetical protein MARPO_0015s0168 [Marchantia polymorpha]BBN01613.1 hypothetical protein Mp_2g08830 [Marchantia polymorpha subsp. ruderalis]|eukprot:PTQ45380.1 hypothetical protein MARPO_0015s0168 [Marchantia polymorpha]
MKRITSSTLFLWPSFWECTAFDSYSRRKFPCVLIFLHVRHAVEKCACCKGHFSFLEAKLWKMPSVCRGECHMLPSTVGLQYDDEELRGTSEKCNEPLHLDGIWIGSSECRSM